MADNEARASDRGWSEAEVPSVQGRRFIVTGANTGLGRETARVLASRGASVVIACRNTEKGAAARDAILALAPGADVTVASLDLASLASVASFAEDELARGEPLHALVCNAGLMAVPQAKTADGFEMQMGTNHLGHFALAARLMPRLRATPGSRVVVVSSGVHWGGRVALLDDPFFEKRAYSRWVAYLQSKLANLLFMYELDRRLRASKADMLSVGAHPGYAATELQGRASQLGGPKLEGWWMNLGNRLLAQSAAEGALPSLRAATDPGARGGDYFGPAFVEWRGRAVRSPTSAAARDAEAARRLWAWSTEVTGVEFAGLSA
jgi:NAD(P)-dependent dehydrogenase (short-subunit alcohol dehydrogenase family)